MKKYRFYLNDLSFIDFTEEKYNDLEDCDFSFNGLVLDGKIIKPEKKDYNELSVILGYQYDVSVVKYVGKNSYLPRPEIDSIVLKFEKVAPRYDVNFNDLKMVVSSLFVARRKTIYNNLKNLFKEASVIEGCLSVCNISANTRVEQLELKQIIDITNYYIGTKN